MALSKPVALCFAVIGMMLLSACGGASGPVLREVPPPDDREIRPEPPEAVIVPSDDDQSGTPPADDTTPGKELDDLGRDLPDSNSASNLSVLTTLGGLDAKETPLDAVVLLTDENGKRVIVKRDGVYLSSGKTLRVADLPAALNNDVAGDYAHAGTFDQAQTVGILGLATPEDALRTTGSATYKGGASGFVITGSNGVDLVNGRSRVDVRFNGNVTVTLDDFDGVSQITGFVVDSPLTEIKLRDAVIADTGFSGGTVTLRTTDGVTDVTGANTTTQARGQFFGLEADGRTPDEVGGMIYTVGDDAIVYGTFIAD